jgi:GNAT superfamily N-acetyltransferase
MNEIKIRQATTEDITTLYPLLVKMGSTDSENSVKKRLNSFLEDKNQYIAVAVYERNIIGYAWVQSYGEHLRGGEITARFNDLFVDSDYRNLGAGKLLFEEIKQWAEKNKVKYLQWQASSTATKFYDKLGLKGDTKSDLEEHPFYEIEFKN